MGDACLVASHCSLRQSCLTRLKVVQALVRRLPNISNALIVPARVPVCKLYSGQRNVCDISVNNTYAVENSRLVGTFSRVDRRVRIIGRLLKHWATRRDINNRAQGTLSTYTLILQLI